MKKIIYVVLALTVSISSCKKEDQHLPPEWNYPIPETAPVAGTSIGAFYSVRVDAQWVYNTATPPVRLITDYPTLNRDGDGNEIPYTYNLPGIMPRQCGYADRAGIDFLILPWNNSAQNEQVLTTFSQAREPSAENPQGCRVRAILNFSFSHLSLDADTKKLTGEGTSFNNIVQEFKDKYATIFSRDFYFRLPDGRPVIILPCTFSTTSPNNYDYSLFVPAFRQAMKEFTQTLQKGDPSVPDNAMNFYFIGEQTTNWLPPQRNEEMAKYLDANYDKLWYPQRYYERYTFFYSYTDMAWDNWRDYAAGWKNDFVPCIFPEYYVNASGSRSIERSIENYRNFCNVAKRHLGSQKVVLINSWNEFETCSALEPADRYGEEYLDLTRQFLKP